jgi:hypothetical protein
VALGRLAQVDGQHPVEDDEDFFLLLVSVTPPARARWIAPDVGARLRHRLRESRDRPAAAIAAIAPVEVGGADDREGHGMEYPADDMSAGKLGIEGRAELASALQTRGIDPSNTGDAPVSAESPAF